MDSYVIDATKHYYSGNHIVDLNDKIPLCAMSLADDDEHPIKVYGKSVESIKATMAKYFQDYEFVDLIPH